MEYEWDPGKAAENLRKHNVDFADAVIALEDENALTIEDSDHNERRFKTLGWVLLLISCLWFIANVQRTASGLFPPESLIGKKPNGISRG